MLFGLKNAGTTYQRLMIKIFKPLIERIVEVYIDDIVMKNRTKSEHAQHLEEIFHLMKRYNMKLNPAEYAFWVNAGKFLGFMVTQRGIEVNLEQIKAVMKTSAPTFEKELQCLTGHLAALGPFIARFTDKLKPFFLTLKWANMTGWTSNYEQAFEKIKRYLTQPPILSNPQPGEQLYTYLAVSDCAINYILFRCVKENEQRPFYYESKAMIDAET